MQIKMLTLNKRRVINMAKNFRIMFLSFIVGIIGFINTTKGVEFNLINRTGQDITISVITGTQEGIQTIATLAHNENVILDDWMKDIKSRGFYINIMTPKAQKNSSLGRTSFFVDYKKLNETEYEIQALTEENIARQPTKTKQQNKRGKYSYPPESLDPVTMVPYWVLTLSGTGLGQTEYIYKPQ